MYAEPSRGKSQICMMAAAMCLRSKEEGGWGRGVVYIDSARSVVVLFNASIIPPDNEVINVMLFTIMFYFYFKYT